MARYALKNPNTYLHCIHVNAKGYGRTGRYFGAGEPVWNVWVDEPGSLETWEFRAPNREAAKAAVLERRQDAVFFH